MVGGKQEALKARESLDPQKELKMLMDELNKLTQDEKGKKALTKELDDRVSGLLDNGGIVDTVVHFYDSLKDPKEKAGLENLIKLAKVNEAVKDEQREINVRLEALKEEQALTEDVRKNADKLQTAVVSQLTMKINELYQKGDYQGALDNAVYLLSTKDGQSAFRMIKSILKSAPSSVTLYIKDNKISYSQRKEWIKKMEDNMSNSERKSHVTSYDDASVRGDYEWTLGKETKDYKEKKATRVLDESISGNKELSKISKHLNQPSAFKLIEENITTIKAIFEASREGKDDVAAEKQFNTELSKKFFFEKGYLPKTGKKLEKPEDLSDKEWKYLKELCLYRIGTDITLPATENQDKKDRAAYEAISGAQIAGVTMNELNKAKNVLDQIDMKSVSSKNAQDILMTLLGDMNWDGVLTNTSMLEGADRKGLDKGTLFGGQIGSMLDSAIKRFGEEKVVTNIETIIQNLSGLRGFKLKDHSIKSLIEAFKSNPAALISFRNKLVNEPDSGMSMFNVGIEYVKTKLDRLNSDASFRKYLEKLYDEGNPEMKEATDAVKGVLVENMESVVKPNLEKAIASLEEKVKTKKASKEEEQYLQVLKGIVEILNRPNGTEEFLNNPAVENMCKNFVISGIGVNFSDISVDGEHFYGGSIGASAGNEKFNAWLSETTKNIVQNASASVGLFCSDGKFSLGFGLGLGSSYNLNENVRAFYNIGGSWSPFNPEGLGFSAVVGAEKRINKNADDSLDLKSAHYIGVAGAYGLGIDLSDSDFNVNTVSGTGWWRQDKLEGVERNAEQLRSKMGPIFKRLFEVDGDKKEVSVETIMENLRGGKMNDGTEFNGFARTSGETLYRTAVKIFNMFNSYKSKLSKEDYSANKEEIIQKITDNFVDHLARDMRNKNIEKIVNEGLHLSGVSIGLSWSFARLFTGFFLSGGLTFTYYEDSEYKENEDMVEQAEKGMRKPWLYEVITNGEKTYEAKMKIINDILRGSYLDYKAKVEGEKASPAYISLSKDVFGKDIKVMCHKDLAKYIKQENGEIKMPGNADISLAKIMHQGKAEYTLILGADSTSECKEVELDKDTNQLKWKEEYDVVFGSMAQQFESYNTEIVTKIESMKVGLDGKPTEALKKYLEDNGDALVKFRLGNANYKKFINAIESDKLRGADFVNKTKVYLPKELADLVSADNEQAKHDIRFIYASLSRVSQTRDKQLSGEALKSKADGYLDKLDLSSDNKALLASYISKVEGGAALSDDEWTKMKGILNIQNGWVLRTANTNAEKLFHILTPVKKLAEARTSSYERRIKSEYHELNLDEGATILINARNEALKKLEGKPTAAGDLKEGWIGAVAGYDLRNSIKDKFVSSPKIIKGSEYLIPASSKLDIVRRHFLDELSSTDEAQFKYIKERIISQLNSPKSSKDDKELAQRWESMSDSDFITAILTKKTENDKGEEVLKVTLDMQYGFFADCVNETILLGNINVVTTTEEQKQAPHDVHYYEAVVTNDGFTTAHSFTAGGTKGWIDSKNPSENPPKDDEEPKDKEEPEDLPEPEDKTEPEAPKDFTKPISNCDELAQIEGIESVDFDCQEFTYNGVRYSFYYEEIDGQVCLVAYDPTKVDGPDLIVLQSNVNGETTYTFIEKDTYVGNLGNAIPVGFPNYEEEHAKWEEEHAEWEKKHAEWEKNHEKYLEEHEKWEKEHAEFLKKHAEWEKKHAEYLKKLEEWKNNEAKYLADHGKFLKNVHHQVRDLSMHLMYLNFMVRNSEGQQRTKFIEELNSTKKKIRDRLIDKIV